jgi:hypothetical protein
MNVFDHETERLWKERTLPGGSPLWGDSIYMDLANLANMQFYISTKLSILDRCTRRAGGRHQVARSGLPEPEQT